MDAVRTVAPTLLNRVAPPGTVPVREARRFPGSPRELSDEARRESPLGHDFSQVPTMTSPPGSERLGSWLPPVARRALADAPLHLASPLAQAAGVPGITVDGAVHLAAASLSLPGSRLQQLLAHEAVHVAQQRRTEGPHDPFEVEAEAHELAPMMLRGEAHPQLSAPANRVLGETPSDLALVERAKRRLKLLETYVREWQIRQARHLGAGGEVDPVLARRRRMDVGSADLGPPDQRGRMEDELLRNLNRLPLDIEVTEDAVRFRVKFQVRFEDPTASRRFGELQSSLRAGIELVWNQRLAGLVFQGRRFVIEPVILPVSATAPRDRNYWLITVRPTDDSPIEYPACSLDKPPPGDPTSVTDPTCDGGVMNIPPLHVTKPAVLGHELLHLFGLVDRYINMVSIPPGKKPVSTQVPTRETRGRRDPLGGEAGTILSEDLTYLFERLGVYRMEETRGLETLRKLEPGLTIDAVRVEIERQKEIIRLGRDPRSLIRIPEDFREKALRDLPP